MVIKISKEIIQILPVTTSLTREYPGVRRFPGWGDIESVTVKFAESWTAYDLQTFLSVLALFEYEQIINRDWETTDKAYIPVSVVSCPWSWFIQQYRGSKLHCAPRIWKSVSRLVGVTYEITYKQDPENDLLERKVLKFLWHTALYYYQQKKYIAINSLRGEGRRPRRLNLGVVIDREFLLACRNGFHVDITPILNLTKAISIILGLWIQGQKYTALNEEILLEVLHVTNKDYKRRQMLQRAFDDIKQVGIIRSWEREKLGFGKYRYCWVKP